MPKSSPAKLRYMTQYEQKPEEVAKRVARNRARRHALAEGKVHKGDGLEIDHTRMLDRGGSTNDANTRVVTAQKNRGWRGRDPGAYGRNKK